MKIKITEEIDTVGYSDAQSTAPLEIASELKRRCNLGELCAAGRVVTTDTKEGDPYTWVVMTLSDLAQPVIVMRREQEAMGH